MLTSLPKFNKKPLISKYSVNRCASELSNNFTGGVMSGQTANYSAICIRVPQISLYTKYAY